MLGDLSLLGLGHLILGFLLSFDILLHKHRPVSAVLWLGVVWGFPLIGALGYLGFGVDRAHRGGTAREASRRLVAQRAALIPNLERLSLSETHQRSRPEGERHAAAHILQATDPAVGSRRVTRGNRARLLVDGDGFFPTLFESISTARSSVHLQTFIFGRDRTGRELRELLEQRARAGVAVRLLYDRFGSTIAHFTNFFRPIRDAGGSVHSITQANPFKGRFQINLRNHRKIAVIDGSRGFVGGINIHDKNRSSYSRGSAIRDYHVELEGPSVSDLQVQFVEDWYFATGETPEKLLSNEYFPQAQPVDRALVQIVPGGPERGGHQLADAVFAAIVSARETIDIVTPYFVPDEPIVHGIRYAALSGVRVRIVLPQRSNHWYTTFAARSLYTPLLAAGVRIFERGGPFIHAKAMVIDGVYAMLGSANMDYRSLHLNFETNIEIVDEGFLAAISEQVESELANSREVRSEDHEQRSLPRRMLENFCYLFQPML